VAEASVRGPTAASLVEINERFAKNVGSDVRALALAA
jgi:hypothetical protein